MIPISELGGESCPLLSGRSKKDYVVGDERRVRRGHCRREYETHLAFFETGSRIVATLLALDTSVPRYSQFFLSAVDGSREGVQRNLDFAQVYHVDAVPPRRRYRRVRPGE